MVSFHPVKKSFSTSLLIAVLFCGIAFCLSTLLNAAEPRQKSHQYSINETLIKEIVKTSQPSVVAVIRLNPSAESGFMGDPLEDWLEQRPGASLPADVGGGTIIGIDAHKRRIQVLTNSHLLTGSSSGVPDVVIKCPHWPALKARLLGVDPVSQFAVLEAELPDRFPLNSLNAAELSSAAEVEQGEFCLLFSDPVALVRQGTSGVGTAIIRRVGWRRGSHFKTVDQQLTHVSFRVWVDRLPESTATGSPVMNVQGKLLGLVAALDRDNVSGEGTEVCPITPQTVQIINDLKQGLEPQSGFLGLDVRRARVDELSQLPERFPEDSPWDHGLILGAVRVESIPENFPLSEEDLAPGDLILAFNQSIMIHHPDTFYGWIESTPPGKPILLTLWRRRTQEIAEVTIHSVPFPNSASGFGVDTARRHPEWRGMRVSFASPVILERKPSPSSDTNRFRFRNGVLVTVVEKGSPADTMGIRPGDLIEKVGEREIQTPADFYDAVESWTNDTPLTVSGRPGEVFVPVKEE